MSHPMLWTSVIYRKHPFHGMRHTDFRLQIEAVVLPLQQYFSIGSRGRPGRGPETILAKDLHKFQCAVDERGLGRL